MILQLDITQMIFAICFLGVWIGLIFYYIGRSSNKFDSNKFETKILMLETKVDKLQEEKTDLYERLNEESSSEEP